MVMISISAGKLDHNAIEQGLTQANGANVNGAPPTADMLGDLLSPLAIEGRPAIYSIRSKWCSWAWCK
ncbi:hypothetical protein Tco_1445730 [Tanacetum coccineum]